MVAILGVFCGYLMYNVWQISADTSNSHRQLKDKISAVQARESIRQIVNYITVATSQWPCYASIIMHYTFTCMYLNTSFTHIQCVGSIARGAWSSVPQLMSYNRPCIIRLPYGDLHSSHSQAVICL